MGGYQMTIKLKLKATAAILLGLSCFSQASAADSWPKGPVTLVVPYNPGGTTDNMVRVIADMMEKSIGSSVVVTNTAGGGGVVGMSAALESKPDGQTVGMYLSNTLVGIATGAAPFKKDDIKPACMFSDAVLTITGIGGVDALKDLDALRKVENPSLAIERGTLSGFAGLLVNSQSKENFKLVNAGGGPKKNAAVMGGHVSALITPTAGVIKQHSAGQLKILAVLSDERLAIAPDLPTAKEQGLDVSMAQSNGFMFPAGTSQDAIDGFCDALEKVAANPSFVEKMEALNVNVRFMRDQKYVTYMDNLSVQISDLAAGAGYAK